MKKSIKDYYIIKDGKRLQYGYTTGSCAAAAAKAAAFLLLGKNPGESISLMTPKGILLDLDVKECCVEKTEVTVAIQKYAGDDPDVTDGIYVYASVQKNNTGAINIDGGKGVGKVTNPGLEQPVGAAAINRVPRQMITQELESVREFCDYEGGFDVIISAPEGEEIAKRTFNPRLGIVGGISILGTLGIVVPMSEEALVKSIEIEMKMHTEIGEKWLLITPGNYGESYLKDHTKLNLKKNIKCSNYVGKTIDMAVNQKVEGILFVAHIGKFIKVAGGIMDTHSKSADCRMEIMAANALRAGADAETAGKILAAVTTDEGLGILKEAGIFAETMEYILERIHFYLNNRSCGQMKLGAILFSNEHGYLGKTADVPALESKLSE